MNIIDEIFKKTNYFDVPLVINDYDFTQHYSIEDVAEAFDNIADFYNSKIRNYSLLGCIRIYVGQQLGGNYLGYWDTLRLFKAYKNRKVSFEDFFSSYFGSQDFLIFINFAGKWSEKISTQSAFMCREFVNSNPDYSMSIEHHIIIGRYDTTPFGVHLDDDIDRVLHINLGPSKKRLLLWRKNEYFKKTGSKLHIESQEGIRDIATIYEFERGQGFLLPAEMYHTGESNDDISISIALAFTKNVPSLVFKNIFDELGRDAASLSGKYDASFNFNSNTELIVRGINTCDKLRMRESCSELASKLALKQKSNMYFVGKQELNYSQLMMNNFFLLKDPFTVESFRVKEGCYFFARGHSILIRNKDIVSKILTIIDKKQFELNIQNKEQLGNLKSIDKIKVWLVATKAFTGFN
jgi:hypothetical protein